MTPEGRAGDPLNDAALRSEIELVGDLVAAASDSEGPLPEGEIDRLLGVPADDQEQAEDPAADAAGQDADEPVTPTAASGDTDHGHVVQDPT